MIAKAFGLLAVAALCMAVAYGVGSWLDYALGSVSIGVTR